MKSVTGLAEIARRHPADRVFAELLNEPDLDADRWQTEVEELAAFVRRLLPRTTIIVGVPSTGNSADSLAGLSSAHRPEHRAIHFYDPMAFSPSRTYGIRKSALHDIRGCLYPIRANDPDVHELRQQLIDGNKAPPALELLNRATAHHADENVIDKWLEPATA